MKYIRLFSLLFIVLFGIVLFSFLGNKDSEGFTQPSSSSSSSSSSGISNHQNTPTSTSSNMTNNYDNYNHYSGTSSTLTAGSMFYGPNGGTVAVQTNSDGTQSLQIVLASGQAPMTFTSGNDASGNDADASGNTTTTTTESYSNYGSTVNGSAAVFYGPNGATATVVNPNNSGVAIQVQTSSGTYTYTQTAPISSATTSNPATVTSTQYYGSTGTPIQTGSSALAYTGPQGNTVGSVTGPQGNSAYYAQGPAGNTAVTTQPGTAAPYAAAASPYYNPVANTAATNNNPYYSSLPPGIPASQILPGNEDLYILKSEVVPPVCPICPSASTSTSKSKKCAPCPACARCPEPAFDCKKVPNYNAMDDSTLPIPVLADFSSFGM